MPVLFKLKTDNIQIFFEFFHNLPYYVFIFYYFSSLDISPRQIYLYNIYFNHDKNIRNSETEKIWKGKKSPKLPPEIHKRAFTKLLIIHSAESEEDLKMPP